MEECVMGTTNCVIGKVIYQSKFDKDHTMQIPITKH